MNTAARASAAASATGASAAAVQRHVGTRRRGTVAAGRYEHVSMPRTTAKHGRDGTRLGSRRRFHVLHAR